MGGLIGMATMGLRCCAVCGVPRKLGAGGQLLGLRLRCSRQLKLCAKQLVIANHAQYGYVGNMDLAQRPSVAQQAATLLAAGLTALAKTGKKFYAASLQRRQLRGCGLTSFC
jgi:hypothetical protein